MRKRAGRPQRFAAVPNETVDDAANLDLVALALLTILIRHRDGWEITLAAIGERYGYGREAMANAMGLLQVARYVVKVRMMSVDGNNWSTEVYVYDTPATDAEVEALLVEIERDPAVRRAEVIEPTKAAYARAAKRRAKLQVKGRQGPSVAVPRVPEIPHSDATWGNGASSQVGPECRVPRQSGDPAVFKKTVGEKTRENEDAPSARSALDAGGNTSGSRERAAGGSAASGKSKPRRSKADLQAIRAVREELARVLPDLAAVLPQATPGSLGDAILAGLAVGTPWERTPGQLVEFRVLPRWTKHWAPRFYAGELSKQPVGPLVTMLGADRSDHDRCDERVDVDTGGECRACAERAADRRAERQQQRAAERPPVEEPGQGPAERPVPAPRGPVPQWWECTRCAAPGKGQAPASGLCAECAAGPVLAGAAPF